MELIYIFKNPSRISMNIFEILTLVFISNLKLLYRPFQAFNLSLWYILDLIHRNLEVFQFEIVLKRFQFNLKIENENLI